MLRTLKSEGKRDIKEDAISWTTTLSLKTINGLQKNYKNGIRNVVALVLVNSKVLSNSAIIYFTDYHLNIKGVFNDSKHTIGMTVRKYSNKNDYLLFVDKKVENAIPVKQNLSLDF